jgi:hypothetical protein
MAKPFEQTLQEAIGNLTFQNIQLQHQSVVLQEELQKATAELDKLKPEEKPDKPGPKAVR